MHKLKNISGKEFIKILEKAGFQKVIHKGSHIILKKKTEKGFIGCVVPMHKELAIGTILGILKQAKIPIKDFMNLIYRKQK